MEVLNHNQRRSALWRVAALFGILIALLVVILMSMHRAYGSQGSGQAKDLLDSLESAQIHYSASLNKKDFQIQELNNQIESLKNDKTGDKKLEELQEKISDLKQDLKEEERAYKKLEKEASRCAQDLRNCRSSGS